MPHLIAAPDKFRGTLSARAAATAMGTAAQAAGWTVDEIPMSDGGEGLLEAVGGAVHRRQVPGPLGEPTSTEWRLLPDTTPHGPTAVIEMAQAAGRAVLRHPRRDDPIRADTAGVGHLILAARDAGAHQIIVGCGGSATTDGGWGCVQVVGSADALAGVDLVVACDVTTPFADAARVYGPQKGATTAQISQLTERLAALAERYRRDFGADVSSLPGAGAAGGLAGGLVALGARLAPGFDLVAGLLELGPRLERADFVISGEGHLDPPSFRGKVPGGVVDLVADRCPVLLVVGGADPALLRHPPAGVDIVSLTERFGASRSRSETIDLVSDVTASALIRFCT
jgi:glycerate 2-kinase